jgi:hypothetical protein
MWWDERSVPEPPVCILDVLPAALLSRCLALLAPSPSDVAAAAGVCSTFRDALRDARLTRREWACAACGAAAFDSDALQPQRGVRWAFLHDGPALAVDARALDGALLAARGARVCEAKDFMLPHHARAHGVRLQPEEADATLAVPGHASSAALQPVVCEALACTRCGLYLGARCTHGGAAWAAVTEAYVRRRLVSGMPDPAPPALPHAPAAALLRCAGASCGAVLARLEDVLSKRHAWAWNEPPPPPPPPPLPHAHAHPVAPLPAFAFAPGEMLPAWYVNHLTPGATVLSQRRREELAQGNFDVEDVACGACGARVGWRFAAHRRSNMPASFVLPPNWHQAAAATTHENVRACVRAAERVRRFAVVLCGACCS